MSPRSKWKVRIATFTNVVVSSDVWIVHNKYCHAVVNGGCKTPDSWRQPKNPIQNYDRVISIAMYWGDGIWHFLLESFVGLARVHTSDCYLKHYQIVVTSGIDGRELSSCKTNSNFCSLAKVVTSC
jgi:hypothetical protein